MNRHVIILASAVALVLACGRRPAIDAQQVSAVFVSEDLPTEDPTASLWDRAPEHPATLMVQDVTEPRRTEPGVGLIRVRALHNRDWVVFRLEWEDATQDLIPDAGRSSDAVAIQFPIQPGADVPNPAMGDVGKPVEICYWKAVWQDDAERAAAGGPDRIATLYPNAAIDHYPFEAGADPTVRDEMARRYAPALAAGNPVTARPHAGPVQQLLAESFGTSTVASSQNATGKGVWINGRWLATIARPLSQPAGLASFEPGQKTYVAFAVWDGAHLDTGSRKMRSGWVPLVLEPGQ